MKAHTYRTRLERVRPRVLLERELPKSLRLRDKPNNAAEYSENPGALRARMNKRARVRACENCGAVVPRRVRCRACAGLVCRECSARARAALDAPGEPARCETPALTEGAGVVARSGRNDANERG